MPRLFPPHAPRVLELRIHGIKNTPPAEMLGVTPDRIRRDAGDESGGFYVETEPAGHPGIRREAYSWGALARTGGGALALVGQLFVHIGWLLILPFGLVNVAYWTREIPKQTVAGAWRGGVGTATLRLFALGLTLFSVTAMASVALDLIGVQCYRAGFVCAQLPSAFDVLPADNRALRLALLALLPIAAMLLLFAIAFRARARFEPNISQGIPRSGYPGQRLRPVPLMASAEFWVQARVSAPTEWLHVSGTLLLLALLLALDALGVAVPACATRDRFVSNECMALDGLLAASAPIVGCAAISLAALGVVAWRIYAGSEKKVQKTVVRRRRMIAAVVLTSSVVVFVATAVVTSLSGSGDPASARVASVDQLPTPTPTTGLEATPTVLIAVLLALCLSGLSWRRGVPVWLSSVVLGSALAALAVWRGFGGSLVSAISADPRGVNSAARESLPWVVIAGVLVGVHLATTALWPRFSGRARSRYVGWRGTGPGVVMLLALGVSMTLASVLVVGASAWLVMPVSASRPTSSDVRSVDLMWRDDGIALGSDAAQLSVPPPYVEFGFALVVIIAVMAIAVVAVAIAGMSRLRMLTTPAVRIGGAPLVERTGYRGVKPPKAVTTDPVELRVLKSRRVAALAQRVEPVLGLLAVTIGVGLAFTVLAQFPRDGMLGDVVDPLAPVQPALQQLLTAAPAIAIASLSAIAFGAVAAVAANALTTKERPVGLLWDLICFLPRAGHPFGPPCYADRVVPEVTARMGAWLDPDDRPDPSRRVIVSAHSLGAVLAVAAILSRGAQTAEHTNRIGLVTYGTQLRAYFGRFFPELLGAEVLGTRPCRGPSLTSADPWWRQVCDDERAGAGPPGFPIPPRSPDSLVGQLSRLGMESPPTWIGLWRRTDYLGFPVNSYATSGDLIDRGASEFEATSYLLTIATHGGYPQVAQYDHAIEALRRRLR